MGGVDFVGAGWAFPLATDATGGIALVVREREIEEAIRLILATAPGERPMRPEFGCRVHDHVFAPINASTAGAIASDVRYALELWEPRIDVQEVLISFDQADLGTAVHRHPLLDQGHQRHPQPGVPVLRHPRGTGAATVIAGPPIPPNSPPPNGDADHGAARPQSRRPALPGSGRRRETAGPATLPGMDRPQRLRPRGDADRGVRADGRPAHLPAEPGAGPALHQVPRADRRRAAAAGGGQRARSPSGCRRRSRRPSWSAGRPRWPLPERMSPIRWSSPRSRTWTSCPARSSGPVRCRPAVRRSTTASRCGPAASSSASSARRSPATRCWSACRMRCRPAPW